LGNGENFFAKLLSKSNNLCGSGSGRIFALPLPFPQKKARFQLPLPHPWLKFLPKSSEKVLSNTVRANRPTYDDF